MRARTLPALLLIAVLFIPGCARAPRATSQTFYAPTAGPGTWHTVEQGQTLYRLSKRYNIDVNELMRANNILHPSRLEAGQRIFIPRVAAPVVVRKPAVSEDIEAVRRIVGPKQFGSDWRTITVHHSATFQGGARLFDRDHRRRKMGGLFYHFVLGNGTSTRDGEIEVGFRWKKQVKANRPYDIQICLVGNFDEQNVSDAQFRSLVDLMTVLREQYNVPLSGVRQHRDLPGKHTDCPGLKFPFSRLLNELSRTGG